MVKKQIDLMKENIKIDLMKKDIREQIILESRFSLKMTAIICLSILSSISLIGMFWGKEVLFRTGIAIMIITFILIIVVTNDRYSL